MNRAFKISALLCLFLLSLGSAWAQDTGGAAMTVVMPGASLSGSAVREILPALTYMPKKPPPGFRWLNRLEMLNAWAEEGEGSGLCGEASWLLFEHCFAGGSPRAHLSGWTI